MKQLKQQMMVKSLRTIRGSYLMYADEHTKVFINNIEKTRSICGNYQR